MQLSTPAQPLYFVIALLSILVQLAAASLTSSSGLLTAYPQSFNAMALKKSYPVVKTAIIGNMRRNGSLVGGENGNRGPGIVLTRNLICPAHSKSLLAPERTLRISVVTACDNLVLIRVACDGRGEHNLHRYKNSTRRALTPSLGRSISSHSLGT